MTFDPRFLRLFDNTLIADLLSERQLQGAREDREEGIWRHAQVALDCTTDLYKPCLSYDDFYKKCSTILKIRRKALDRLEEAERLLSESSINIGDRRDRLEMDSRRDDSKSQNAQG